jgi:hypothetical protein
MTREELDQMWSRAMEDAISAGEMFTRYRFAEMVAAAEREACALVADDIAVDTNTDDFALDRCYEIAAAIRARGEA